MTFLYYCIYIISRFVGMSWSEHDDGVDDSPESFGDL